MTEDVVKFLETGHTPEDDIYVTMFDENDIPYTGDLVARFKDGAWRNTDKSEQ